MIEPLVPADRKIPTVTLDALDDTGEVENRAPPKHPSDLKKDQSEAQRASRARNLSRARVELAHKRANGEARRRTKKEMAAARAAKDAKDKGTLDADPADFLTSPEARGIGIKRQAHAAAVAGLPRKKAKTTPTVGYALPPLVKYGLPLAALGCGAYYYQSSVSGLPSAPWATETAPEPKSAEQLELDELAALGVVSG